MINILYLLAITALFVLLLLSGKMKLYAPVIAFLAVWILVPFVSSLRLYDLNSVSGYAIFIIWLGCITFVLGCCFRIFFPYHLKNIGIKNSDYRINYMVLILIYTISLLFTAFLASRSISLMLKGASLQYIRHNFRNLEESVVISSNGLYLFETYVIQMCEYAAVALLPLVIADKLSVKKIILSIEMIAFLILHLFVTGSRSFVMHIIVLFAAYFLINNNAKKTAIDYFKKIPIFVYIAIVIGAGILVLYATVLRKGSGTQAREFYRYLAISCPLLDHHLEMIHSDCTYTYGWTMIYGFIRPIISFLHMIGIPFPPGFRNTIDQFAINNVFYSVGGGKANSYVTIFYYMYMDFGIISLIIQMLIYGYFCQTVYEHMEKYPNIRNVAFYLLIFDGLVFSFSRHAFTSYRYTWAFIILLLAFKKKKQILIG